MTNKEIIETIKGIEATTGNLTPYGSLGEHSRIDDICELFRKLGAERVIDDLVETADNGEDLKYAFYRTINEGKDVLNYNSVAVRDIMILLYQTF